MMSENSTHLQYSGSALVGIQPLSPSFDRLLTLSRAALIYYDKKAQAKVTRARARVCRGAGLAIGYATALRSHSADSSVWS